MSRSQLSQSQRTRKNPLLLGEFGQTAIRYLTGKLGPLNQLVGRADTSQYSNGGFGGGTYNHWFQVELTIPAWIIIAKGEPRPKYIQVSVYDLNQNPISGRSIFDGDSVSAVNGEVYYPYVGHSMSTQSDFYNSSNQFRVDRGDDRYYPMPAGKYLICVSSTRNEPIEYSVGIVIETADLEPLLVLEDYLRLLFEDVDESAIICDIAGELADQSVHEHSLTEWKSAWEREHPPEKPFPPLLVPLTTVP